VSSSGKVFIIILFIINIITLSLLQIFIHVMVNNVF